jgi:cell division protease FtsH
MRNGPVRRRGQKPAPWLTKGYLWWVLGCALLLLLGYGWLHRKPGNEIEYGRFLQLLSDPHVKFEHVQVTPTQITGQLKQPGAPAKAFVTSRAGLENDPELVPLLRKKLGAHFSAQSEENGFKAVGLSLIAPLSLTLLLGGFLFWALRRTGGHLLPYGRAGARPYSPEELHCSFGDVAGIDEAVEELREIVDFLKTPEKYRALGGRIPKGVLLVGPPGTGKTLLARAVAGEAGVPFFSMSSSGFVELFVGVGAARVRDLFAQAEQRAPCIIFLDELDALGKTRGGSSTGSHDEREQTLNQLLVEMDGFENDRGVIIMAATNRPEILDPALLRPGRFDRTIVVDRPDINGREAILKVHARHVRLTDDVNLRELAGLTSGFVGADLANVINEAALLAARKGRKEVRRGDLDEAVERSVAGLERKRRIMLPAEKQRIAYHESGHALVACALPAADPVHKVSIIPRGVAALGYTMQRPEQDRYVMARSELVNQIKVLLGGTLAEELVYNECSTGAQNDLERATQIARSMVKQFGMSRLGRVYYQSQNPTALPPGAQPSLDPGYSEQTSREIDMEVRTILEEAATEVRQILRDWRQAFEILAQRLLEQEVVSGGELHAILTHYAPVSGGTLESSDGVAGRTPPKERKQHPPPHPPRISHPWPARQRRKQATER